MMVTTGATAATTGRVLQGRSLSSLLNDRVQELHAAKANSEAATVKLKVLAEELENVGKDINQLEMKQTLSEDEQNALALLFTKKENLLEEERSLNSTLNLLQHRIQAARENIAVGGGWEMMRVPLPRRGFHTIRFPQEAFRTIAVKPKLNDAKFPFVPMKVRTLSHDNFIALAESVEIIDDLNATQTTKLEHDDFSTCHSVENEDTIRAFCYFTFGKLARHLSTFDLLHVKLNSLETIGDAGFTVGQTVKHSNDGKVVEGFDVASVGELTIRKECSSDYSRDYCDHGCMGCETSERHKTNSMIRRLYNYMVFNGVFFGIVNSYHHHAGFIRDCKGNLLITPCLEYDVEKPYTVSQFASLFLALAAKKEIPSSLLGENGSLEPCDAQCKHTNLPKQCFAQGESSGAPYSSSTVSENNGSFESDCPKQPVKLNSQVIDNSDALDQLHGAQAKMIRPKVSYFGGNSAEDALSVHDLITKHHQTSVIGRFDTGISRRVLLWGNKSVMKIADLVKKPDLEQELVHEYAVYQRLSELSGACVPYVIAHGYLRENMLYGFATSHEGKVPEGHVDKDFVDAAKATLVRIHDRGVLHGDMRLKNVLYRSSDSAPIFINFGMSELYEPGTLSHQERNREMAELEAVLLKLVRKRTRESY